LKSEEERGSMTETNESAAGGREPEREEEELRAEEESAKAMEAEVPHPEGYTDGGQEPPA
jgi:transposase-like protein